MIKHKLNPYIRITLFLVSVLCLYAFWEWGGAQILSESVKNPATVEAHFIGMPAPELIVSSKQMWTKQEFRLSSVRGFPVVLHFWATWCGPCLQELPELLAVAPQLRAKGFSLVTVAVDESWAKLETFFARYPKLAPLRELSVMVLDPDGKIAQAFGSSRFPETFLINAEGLIDNKLTGAQPWASPQMAPYLERLKAK